MRRDPKHAQAPLRMPSAPVRQELDEKLQESVVQKNHLLQASDAFHLGHFFRLL